MGHLTILMVVGQGPIALAVGVGGVCLDIFTLLYLSLHFLPLWETARYRLKYCLKELLNPKYPNILSKGHSSAQTKWSFFFFHCILSDDGLPLYQLKISLTVLKL